MKAPRTPIASACTEHLGAECVPWPTGGTEEYVLFTEGDDLYDAMVAAIGAARVLLDTAGSWFSFSDGLESYLRQHGVVVRRFSSVELEATAAFLSARPSQAPRLPIPRAHYRPATRRITASPSRSLEPLTHDDP